MKYPSLGFALLIAGLAIAVQVDNVNASSSYTSEATKEAYATFESRSGGITTSVEINVQEVERTTPEGSEHGLHAGIEIIQEDSRGKHDRMINVAGSMDTEAGAFVLDPDLTSGKIATVIPVCGARAGHDARLKQRPFEDCFDVQVSLEWVGTGELYASSGEDQYPAAACMIHVTSEFETRTAHATGTVLVGKTNLAAAGSLSSMASTYAGTTTATCPD